MLLHVQNLSKRYNVGKEILNNITFKVNKGEVLVLCGASGTGKTTLIRNISGLLGFDSGKITIGDEIVYADKPYPSVLYGKVGVLFQHHNLFPHMTALQNVSAALKLVKKMSIRDAEEKAMGHLQDVGLEEKAGSYPAILSGGESQRVAIARALAVDPLMLESNQSSKSFLSCHHKLKNTVSGRSGRSVLQKQSQQNGTFQCF
jgi:ABC-type polar amino acid transport system ATPase subunit